MKGRIKIFSALISVFDKTGLEPIIKKLDSFGVSFYSTGGTETFIKGNLGQLDEVHKGKPFNKLRLFTNFPYDIKPYVKRIQPGKWIPLII